jgi:hypothetical protein
MAARLLAILVFASILGACTGGGSPAMLPQPKADSAMRRKVAAKLVIRVPHPHKKHRRGKRPLYVSPATAYLTYEIDRNSNTYTQVDISTSNPACSVVGPISYLQCTVNMALAPGQHTFTFSTYDEYNQLLSANTAVSYDVKVSQANQVPVILGGVAASIAVIAPNDPTVEGSQAGGYSIYDTGASSWQFVTQDVDGNFIIGPGAPQPAISPGPFVAASPEGSIAPNAMLVKSSFSPSDPTTTQSSTLAIVATPVPNSGGPTLSTTVSLRLAQPWIFTANGQIDAFDEIGNDKSVQTTFGSECAGSCTIVASDPHNHYLYVSDGSAVYKLDAKGNNPKGFGPSNGKGSITLLGYSQTRNWIYMAQGNTITATDENFNAQTLSGGFKNVSNPYAIVDGGGVIYVGNSNDAINEYDPDGNQLTEGSDLQNFGFTRAMAYDSNNGLLYACSGPSTIEAFDSTGNHVALSGSWSSLTDVFSMLYDPYLHRLYVLDVGGMYAFDEQGNQQNLFFSSTPSAPMAILGP